VGSIELQAITKVYGQLAAVESVDLDVQQGELVTILGPSGSGKTTLLVLIAGLVEPSGGHIFIGGRDVTWAPTGQRNVGLVFQSYALFPHMSVFDNVAFPLSVRKQPRAEITARVDEALRTVRLQDFSHRKPSQLSGGQQQRVALARAFVFEPEILLLDEPLAALDRKLREEVQVELRQLQKSLGITTILVTHDQEEALSLSDRIVVLDHGRVQQIGTPEDGYLRPANRFVADFLGTANFFEGPVRQVDTGWVMELGEARVPCGEPSRSADRSQCMIVRPEKISLNGDTGSCGLKAKVRDVIYLGQTVRYLLDTESGKTVVAVAAPTPRYAAGETVRVHWRSEDAWFVDEGGSP
jgi:putative spermidine/putrescine transport system ATP-binding protein